ncbi:phage antirepressor KilAC domain-containing protein [Leptospira jelokensis]|uniref:KilA-N domain-containing protein n=1 Tax=Leptospira jelokensis TaxID=2484931 RepID=A0A4Z0ZNJ8_9LEPT|nr:phage antirepressor KilAC domain-containing protein [Leptospira jelokensis]TGL58586.1 hypothetical protein EHQ62_16965 [Leptospira jelokensis]
MELNQTFLTYPKDDQIHRIEYKKNGYVNVTEMAKIFGKDQFDFFRHKTANEYIQALSRSTGLPEGELKYVIQGGNQKDSNRSVNSRNGEFAENTPNKCKVEQGTFCHPKLAIRFAQWLNADFAVWVDGKILEILNPPTKEESFEEKTLSVIQGLLSKVETQKHQIEDLTPKAEFADHVAESESHFDFREVCKELALEGIGEKRLFSWCRDHGILMSSNEPYQEYVGRGLLKLVLVPYSKGDGTKDFHRKPVWTGKGLQWLDKKLRESGFREAI